jgi:hypothetical protein
MGASSSHIEWRRSVVVWRLITPLPVTGAQRRAVLQRGDAAAYEAGEAGRPDSSDTRRLAVAGLITLALSAWMYDALIVDVSVQEAIAAAPRQQ